MLLRPAKRFQWASCSSATFGSFYDVKAKEAFGGAPARDRDMLNRIWKASERIGFLLTIVCVIAWLLCGAIGVRAAGAALTRFPMLAQIVIVSIATMVGTGSFVSFWLVASHVDYLRRGYRMRWVAEDQWLYEERASDDAARLLPCVRLILGRDIRLFAQSEFRAKNPGIRRFLLGPKADELRSRGGLPIASAATMGERLALWIYDLFQGALHRNAAEQRLGADHSERVAFFSAFLVGARGFEPPTFGPK